MSGGSSKVDPYYEKDPKKRSRKLKKDKSKLDEKGRKKPIELPPSSYKGPTKILKVSPKFFDTLVNRRKSGLLWYDCDMCGKLYPLSNQLRKRGPNSFDSPECLKKHRQGLFSGLPVSDKHMKKLVDGHKKAFADSKLRKKMSAFASRPDQIRRRAEGRKRKARERRSDESNPYTKADLYRTSQDWRKKSKQIQNSEGDRCRACGLHKSDLKKLATHHVYPLSKWIDDGNEPEDYPDELLIPLCEKCHPATDAQDTDFKWPKKPGDE